MIRGDRDHGIDADEPYRWRLWRRWAEAPPCVFVMLNPSTADDRHDDPTIRRCVGFARAWGFGGVEVVNLFALRATDPADLRAAAAPVGAGNDAAIAAAVARGRAGAIVVAWGVHGALHGRDREVAARLAPYRPRCLGVTRDGAPRHPLYVRADARAVPWSPPRPAPSRSGR